MTFACGKLSLPVSRSPSLNQKTDHLPSLAHPKVIFFCLNLDRGNIGVAVSDNMLGDLGMNTNDYNN